MWDEEAKEWRPRWGYKRANDSTKDWCIEVPDQAGKCCEPLVIYLEMLEDVDCGKVWELI